jgi:hypothetical protein
VSLLLWDEALSYWQAGDFRVVHDWLNERWARVVQERPEGAADPFARFLQGLAFAALAFHFADEQNRESAGLFVADALAVLPRFAPAYAGIATAPLIDALGELQTSLGLPEGLPLPPRPAYAMALRFMRGAAA